MANNVKEKSVDDSVEKRVKTETQPSPVSGIVETENRVLVKIGPDTAIPADRDTGQILGTCAEGTLAIVIYGGDPTDLNPDGTSFRTERAIRIPRLLQADLLLNFHVAEIAYHEGRQASRFRGAVGLCPADQFYRTDLPNPFAKIPGSSSEALCYVGFYLTPTSDYQLCLLSEEEAWPSQFAEYLHSLNKQPGELFEQIGKWCESMEHGRFSRLLFLPHRSGISEEWVEPDELLRVVNREDLHVAHVNRETGGWWFNFPVASYPWMTADLERLLTGYLDESEREASGGGREDLTNWRLDRWFTLVQTLALGLHTLHLEGALHGDPRPANIMAGVRDTEELRPESFRWIDIGLGYGAQLSIPVGGSAPSGESDVITPPPLGGGRVTPFYSPEREEATDYEDADVIRLEKVDNRTSRLTFHWKRRTHHPPIQLKLKDGRIPVRELGVLQAGDRIQVREFVFDVENVDEDGITISRIYELFLDRVMIEKIGVERDIAHRRLKEAAISRYRIFKQWSQATDIYGLGITTLYLFFSRGLHTTGRVVPQNLVQDATAADGPVYDKGRREIIFGQLVSLLRHQSFLEVFLDGLVYSGVESYDQLWRREAQLDDSESGKALKESSKLIYAIDSNFEFIWRGLNFSHGLFAQVVFFCLCCLWRQDEVGEIAARTGFQFEPFSPSRSLIKLTDNPNGPAEKAEQALRALISFVSNESTDLSDAALSDKIDDVALSNKIGAHVFGGSREDQILAQSERIMSLENRVEVAQQENQALEDRVEVTQQENQVLEDRVGVAQQENQALENRAEVAQQENHALKNRVEVAQQENHALKNQTEQMQERETEMQERETQTSTVLDETENSLSTARTELPTSWWRRAIMGLEGRTVDEVLEDALNLIEAHKQWRAP